MRKKNKTMRALSLCLSGTLLLCTGFPTYAEEVTPAGYHVYDVQEDEVSDTWYGIGRGDYLRAGVSKLLQGDEDGYAVCSGNTLAHRACDRLYVRIYLDQSDNGTDDWGTIDYWTGEAFDASIVAASSGQYRVDRDKYYSVTGVHSVTQGDKIETTDTCTDALYFD